MKLIFTPDATPTFAFGGQVLWRDSVAALKALGVSSPAYIIHLVSSR
ncbi:hypothetical protein [Aliidiomarina soli]|nr:hypothetical protein [Aliidiomarina soli]